MHYHQDKALNTFRSGMNCAQSVLTAYTEKLDFDHNFALSVTAGFGAGMGRLQETCGAVTGAFMVLSIHNSKKFPDINDQKENTYTMIQDFNSKFIDLNGTTNCRALLNCDLRTEKGQQYAKDNNLFEIVCEKCVLDSVKIIEELIG